MIRLEKDLLKSIEINPQDISTYLNMGLLMQKSNRDDQAMEVYQKALIIEPANLTALSNIFVIYLNQKKYKEAQDWYNKIISIDSHFSKTDQDYINLAVMYQELKLYDSAWVTINKAISLNLENSNAYSVRGSIYQKRKRILFCDK